MRGKPQKIKQSKFASNCTRNVPHTLTKTCENGKESDPLYKSNTVEPLILAEPFARHRMEPSLEAAQLPAALGGAGCCGAAARLAQAAGDYAAVDAARSADHKAASCFTYTMTGMWLDTTYDAASTLLELQRRQRSR